MDIYLASDGSLIQSPHALSDYDSLEGVYADVSAATGLVSGNVLLFTADGRELKQEVLEELWERGGGNGAGQSSPRRQIVYLFNRETFFSEPERWVNELREDVVLPPPLDASAALDLSHAQAPFAVAYDHLCHLQSLFKAQAAALQIAYANLAFHLQPIVEAFRDFAERADGQLDHHEKLLRGYDIDMAMLPKVTVHESLFRRRDKEADDAKRKSLVDWIHTKKMEQVRDWCQSAHTDYVNRYNTVVAEMDQLAIQSQGERDQAEARIEGISHEFDDVLGRIELASQQVEALMESSTVDFEQHLLELDHAMRADLTSMTQIKNDFTLDLHLHLRQIADFQVRITKFSRPMTDLDLDLRQKNAFPHLERLHHLPFAYAANVVEIVHRKEFSTALVGWSAKIATAVNEYLAVEAKRRKKHKIENQLPWEVAPLEESQTPRVDIAVGGGADALASVGLGRSDIDDIMKWLDGLSRDPSLVNEDVNPVPDLTEQVKTLVTTLDSLNGELTQSLEQAVASVSGAPPQGEVDELRAANAEYERRLAELEQEHIARINELEDLHEQRVNAMQTRTGELQEELVRLREDLGEEMVTRQQLMTELDEKNREFEDRGREFEEQSELLTAVQVDMQQEKDRATDLGVRLQEALLDVDGLRSAEHTLIIQIREMQEERTRTLTDLGEAQLLAQNYESELAGTKAELDATAVQLVQAQHDRDEALKSQSEQAERLMRDHIAEADGDRAVLEHQNLTLTKELETVKARMTEQISSLKNASIRREDGLKAELGLTKAQLREVQRRETVLADDLGRARDASQALTQKESHHADLAKDAVALAGKYHDACQRLMGALAASTTISGSLSLPARAKTPPVEAIASPTSADLRESTVLVRSLETAAAFELPSFTDAVLRTINLTRKLSKSLKQYRELSRNKITIANFGKGDLVLFLPTRNAAVKAWAAFNISAPHHFLHVTDAIEQQLASKDYYLARIAGTEEAVVNGDSPETNPFGLAEGLRYYSHRVEDWTPTQPRLPRRAVSASVAVESSRTAGPITPVPTRIRSESSYLPQITPKASENEQQPSILSPLQTTPAPHVQVPSQPTSPTPLTQSPTVARKPSPQPRVTSPPPLRTSEASVSPMPIRFSDIGTGSNKPTLAKLTSPMAQSPPPPHSSPTSPINLASVAAAKRSHRASLTSTASPPARDGGFAPSSAGRPSSVASSTSSHPRGLPIPAGSAKGSPAAAITTSADGSPSPSSFGETGPTQRRVAKKTSVASLKTKSDDLFKPSPLGSNDPVGTSSSGFLSGLSLSRNKRQSISAAPSTALDLLKKLDGAGGGGGAGAS
ncbi:Autophagy-related protein 11 [Vanrija pseudolonga]|uniref:Autophagy-related protein 11 n=1 Tax=Vanrija pseudolonga TaxID=143232 RepID=A0AAF0Y1W4_9TREE|nr:Autophagy-related protein 11 [Vanrija pseudolonga]